uniref:Putative secreted protein n=1 Tax=Ixodes ricinus TaxID=34613 RepID=A0A6B0UEM5_IXORI
MSALRSLELIVQKCFLCFRTAAAHAETLTSDIQICNTYNLITFSSLSTISAIESTYLCVCSYLCLRYQYSIWFHHHKSVGSRYSEVIGRIKQC